jgi:Histidine kinase-like ATPase domain
MTANPLRLVSSAAGGVGWHWLTSAVEMAALASGNCPLAPEPGATGWTCSSRIARRTPAADASSVCAARGFAVATLRHWGVADRCEDVAVVVSELLTNALRHAVPRAEETQPRADGTRPRSAETLPRSAGTLPRSAATRRRWPIRLGLLQCGPCVLCAVADPCESAPAQAKPGELAETGRGLEVIGALSDSWGYITASDMGKIVWAMFSTGVGAARPVADEWSDWLTNSQGESAFQ